MKPFKTYSYFLDNYAVEVTYDKGVYVSNLEIGIRKNIKLDDYINMMRYGTRRLRNKFDDLFGIKYDNENGQNRGIVT